MRRRATYLTFRKSFAVDGGSVVLTSCCPRYAHCARRHVADRVTVAALACELAAGLIVRGHRDLLVMGW